MIHTERHDNWDLTSTLIKANNNDIIKVYIDDKWKTVKDWYIDWATMMLNVVFEEDGDDNASMFKLGDKFIVEITTVTGRHRRIKHKRIKFPKFKLI